MKKFFVSLWEHRTRTFSFIQGLTAVFAGMTDVMSVGTVKILLAVNAVLTFVLSQVNTWEANKRQTQPPSTVGLWLIALLLPLLLLACTSAESQSIPVRDTLSWTMPTQNTDGTALPASAIARTTIAWGAAPGGPYDSGTQDVTAPATGVTLTRPGQGLGTRCYRAAVATTTGEAGLWSNEVCKSVRAPPAAPTNLTVQ